MFYDILRCYPTFREGPALIVNRKSGDRGRRRRIGEMSVEMGAAHIFVGRWYCTGRHRRRRPLS
jgi:hypothetical protein